MRLPEFAATRQEAHEENAPLECMTASGGAAAASE
jgi:hypothetical protein